MTLARSAAPLFGSSFSMNHLAKITSLVTLGMVIVPCLLFFQGSIELKTVKLAALIGTIGWFVATPLWMSRNAPADSTEGSDSPAV